MVRPTSRLLASLHDSRADGSHASKMARLDLVDFLVPDDFGLRPLSVQAVGDLHDTISPRYGSRPMATTSNRAMKEWAGLLGNDLLAGAALDRPTHYTQTAIMRRRSCRQLSHRKEVEGRGNKTPMCGLQGSKGCPPIWSLKAGELDS